MGSTQTKKQEKQFVDERMFIVSDMVKRSVLADPFLFYEAKEKIGEGCYSQVFKAQSRCTTRMRVIKKVQRKGHPKLGRQIINQFEILRDLDHPNIIRAYEMFEDENHQYIVTEYLGGKDGLDLLVSHKQVEQELGFNIFYQCLLALSNLHKNKVMHRDIKLENVVFDQKTKCFKLIDFDSALRFSSSAPRERRCTGTIHYMAPEVINKYYNMKCDIWSLGVMLYILLCGHAPFIGTSKEEIVSKTLKETLTFEHTIWQKRSIEVKRLLTLILDKNPETRPGVSDIMKDPWVISNLQSRKLHPSQKDEICLCLQRLLKFRKIKLTDIQLGVLLFMIHFIIKLDNEAGLIRAFFRIDTLCDGDIDQKQLQIAFTQYLKIQPKNAEVFAKDVISKIDLNGSKDISYSEFILGVTDLHSVLTSQNIRLAFQYIDDDHSGNISIDQLQNRLGDHLDESQYKKLIGLFDTNGDCQINLKEFSKMMTDLLLNY